MTCSVTLASSQREKYQYTPLPGWEVHGQMPPGATSAHHVQDRVHHVTAGVLLGSASGVGRWGQGLDQGPLVIGQVRGQVGRRGMVAMLAP